MGRFLLVCFGGALGSGARFALASWCAAVLGTTFPYGTLAVNLIGSFLLELLMHVGLSSEVISPALRLTVASGVLGGFTTYSSFNYETLRLVEEGSWLLGGLNLVVTVVGCLVAGWLGIMTARLLRGS